MVKELLLKSLIYLTKSYVCAKSLQSCPILCNPMDCGPTRLLCPFSRQEYWSGFAMSSLQGIFPTRDQTRISYVSCISRRVLYHSCHLVTWYTNSCSSLSCISHHPVSTMARARAHTWEVKSCCCSCRPSRRSQDRTVLSKPPVQSLVPSLEMSIQLAPSVWPWNCLKMPTRRKVLELFKFLGELSLKFLSHQFHCRPDWYISFQFIRFSIIQNNNKAYM